MPAVNTGRSNVSQKGKSSGKAKVRRAKAKPVAGPPAPKRPVTVAPADRTVERADRRQQQLKKSVRKAGDAPQDRAADQKRAEGAVKKQYAGSGRGSKGFYKPGTTVPPDVAMKVALRQPRKQSAAAAPVMKVLEQTARPIHAIASASDAALTGKNIPDAAVKGIKNESKTTFSDVLKHAGVKNKTVRSVAGFGLDVALDPTTYVTFGTGGVVRKAALKQGERAAEKAAKAGLSEKQVAKFRDRAVAQAEKAKPDSRGVAVKFAGKEVPGVRGATAKASKPVRVVGRRVVPEKVRAGARAVAADVNPDIAPAGVSRETSRKAVQATRTARAKSNRGLHEAQQQAVGIKQQVGEANYQRVIDAIENGTIGKLPPELRDVAVRVRSQFRHANRLRKTAGIRGGEIKKRGRVTVPDVVADTDASAKALGKARRAEVRAHADLESARSSADVHQGRAEVLSRNVSGARGEKAAERGRRKRKVKRPARVMYHVVRDSAVSKDTKLESIQANGLKPSSNGHVFLYDDLAQAKEFSRGNGHILEVNVDGLKVEGGAGAATRSIRGGVPKVRVRPYREGAPVQYAGGGHGVRQTATAAKDAGQRARNATAAREAAEKSHAQTVKDASAQRTARDEAVKTNEKRAAAPKEYIPHDLTEQALEAEARAAGGVGRKVIRPSSSRARKDNRPLSEIRKTEPGKFSEDLPTLYANRKAEGATSVARAQLNRRIADLGTDVRKGKNVTLKKGESVYHVVGSDIRKVDEAEAARVIDKGGEKGRYVVLNDEVVKRAVEGSSPTLQGPGIVRGLDKAQAGFKRLALATPGFHVRNAVGDTQNAYLNQPAYRLPKNMVDAGRVLKAEGRRDKGLRALDGGKQGAATVKTPQYGNVTYDKVAEELSKHGAMRSGYTAREIPELSGGEKATLRRVRLPKRAKSALLNREDLPRVTTAIEALKKGATWEEAAQKVADYHFDYAHLTSFERNIARRGAPFYTFTARNIPLQFKSLASKPGKFANYQKLIEETSKAAGMDQESQKHRALADELRQAGVKLPKGWESMMSEWEQRNAGVPISWKGQKFTVSFGIPLAQGLNAVPGAAGKGQADEYFKTAMSLVTPVVKNPVEYFNNYSFFFRDQIERDNSPLVSAPSYVSKLPESTRKSLGITKGLDKRTGKLIWRWPGKVDYIVKTVPGLPQYAQQLATEGSNRRGKGTGGKLLQLAGVRAEPFDPERTLTNLAYERASEIQKRQAALRQSVNAKNGKPVSADNPTPEYLKLAAQLKVAQRVAYQGQKQQGYKNLPKQGAPKKLKVPKGGFDFQGGGQDFDFSGGSSDFDFG